MNQKYMTKIVNQTKGLGRIKDIDWVIYEDNEEYCDISYMDENGKIVKVPFHSPGNITGLYEIDCVIHNIMLQRVFNENGIECPYIYPISIDSISGLVNDVKKLFRMKEQGNDSEFAFEYCLPYASRFPKQTKVHKT